MPPIFVPDLENPDSDYLQPSPEREYYIPRTKSKWKREDLADKSVEFVWNYRHVTAVGNGSFIVHQFKGKDGLYIEIEANATTERLHPKDNYHALHQRHVDHIEIHPEAGRGGKYQFRMIA